MMLENLRVAGGLLYCKNIIWGYFIEAWTGDKLYVRTEYGTYNESAQEWFFPGSWITPGAPAITAVNHKF